MQRSSIVAYADHVQIHLDLFPCRVTTPGGVYDKARVAYVDGRAHVFQADAERRVVEVASAEVPVVPLPNRWPYVLTTAAGDSWTVERGAGCGCGHPLKRARLAELMQLVSS